MLPYSAKNSFSLDHHFHRLLFKKYVLGFEGFFANFLSTCGMQHLDL